MAQLIEIAKVKSKTRESSTNGISMPDQAAADDFFRAIETPALQPHCPKSILAAHALLHLFVGSHFEVFAQFLI